MGCLVFCIFVCGICPLCCFRKLEARGFEQLEFSAVAGAGVPVVVYAEVVPHTSITNAVYAEKVPQMTNAAYAMEPHTF